MCIGLKIKAMFMKVCCPYFGGTGAVGGHWRLTTGKNGKGVCRTGLYLLITVTGKSVESVMILLRVVTLMCVKK